MFNSKENPCSRGEKIIRLVTQPIVENETTADFSHFEVDEEKITSNSSSPAPSLTELQGVNPWIIELIDDDNPEMPTKYNNNDTDQEAILTSNSSYMDIQDLDDNPEMLIKCYNNDEDREAILTSNSSYMDVGDGDIGDLDVEESNLDDHTKDPNYSPLSSEMSDGESTLEDSFIYTKENEEAITVIIQGIESQEGEGRQNILVPYSDTESEQELEIHDNINENVVDDDKQNRGQRKRQRNKMNWTRNKAKYSRNTGQKYVNRTGKCFAAREVKNVDCSKCKFKCHEYYSELERQKINNTFWSSGSYERRGDFICKFVKTDIIARRRPQTDVSKKLKKMNSFKYFLPGEKRVCKNFFLKTLDISQKTVQVAKKKEINLNSSLVDGDMRGRHVPHNKTKDESIQYIKKHIESFPKMESHYCRASSKRQYLAPDLNISKMYELYIEKCNIEDVIPVKIHVYRKIFNTHYNLSFHKPKKDTCILCEKMKNMSDGERLENQETFDNHLKNKSLARLDKDNDKLKAKECQTFKSFTFDLQSVLYTPCSQVSSFYYARKFCSYNCTFYDQGNGNGQCFFWTETNGKRGSDEIGTSIYSVLENLPESVKHVSFFSDSCGGQNRNRYIATILHYAVQKLSVDIIDLKFLETGHTQMEVDSMHSTIEAAKKNRPIYSPTEWPSIIQDARRRKPYNVKILQYSDIYDLKALKRRTIKNDLSHDVNGDIVNWMRIKFLRFEKKSPDHILIKTSFDEENFRLIPLCGRKKTRKQSSIETTIPKKYDSFLKVSASKKKDLVQLCKTGVIPNIYHDFYLSLPSTSNSVSEAENLPEPDINESDNEELID